MKNKVEIVGHSVDPRGNELLSVLVTFPRIILAEVNTHRMLSKNTSSSRAIPFNKMVQSIRENPFIPIAWQKSHSGMQGTEYITDEKQLEDILANYDNAINAAINRAEYFTKIGVTKQLANRLLEPFMWTTMLITGSKEGWDNFFELRCPSYHIETDTGEYNKFKSWKELCKRHYAGPTSMELKDYSLLQKLQHNKGQAEIHIMDLAEKIYDVMNESTPKKLKPGEFHIPFESKITGPFIYEAGGKKWVLSKDMLENEIAANEILIDGETVKSIILNQMVRISTSMAARTSYTLIEGIETSNEKHLDLYHRLIAQDPPHSSPMEHCARAMSDEEYYSSIKTSNYPIIVPRTDKDFKINGGIVNRELYPQHEEYGKDIDKSMFGWSRNFKGFIPLRHLVETEVKKFN